MFLVIFYFNYIKFVEKNTFLHQIDTVLDDLTKNIYPYFPKGKAGLQIQKELQQLINKLKKENSQSDTLINNKNQHLSDISMNMIYICISIFLIYTFVLTINKVCLPLKSVLIESILALCFIALTEYLFLRIVVVNYKSIDSNYIKRIVAEAIRTFAEKQIS